MARLNLCLAMAVAVWVSSTATADAQVDSDPSGPTCVAEDATTSLYESTVTCDGDFVFSLRVYHEGVRKHYTNTFVVNSGPTYAFTKTVSHSGWGMYSGDELNYRSRATEWSTRLYDQDDWLVTVSDSGGCRASDMNPADVPAELHHAFWARRFDA